MKDVYITPGFYPLDSDASSYFLDTNVWSTLSRSPKAARNFLNWLKSNNAIAALSMYTVFELSRADKLHRKLDNLLTKAATRIYIPLLYDELSDLEMSNYPNNQIELLWTPMTNFIEKSEVNLISKISKDPRFIEKRQEFLDFGLTRFMDLESLKQNFPFEDEDGKYSTDHAELFAWTTSIDFLVRHFPEFLVPYKGDLENFKPSKLRSLYFRGLFLYFKFYAHGQSPNESDFMDFAHVSYLPYMDNFVTERNVLNVLTHMKTIVENLPQFELFHVDSFVSKIELGNKKKYQP